jgi:hypothetical protein
MGAAVLALGYHRLAVRREGREVKPSLILTVKDLRSGIQLPEAKCTGAVFQPHELAIGRKEACSERPERRLGIEVALNLPQEFARAGFRMPDRASVVHCRQHLAIGRKKSQARCKPRSEPVQVSTCRHVPGDYPHLPTANQRLSVRGESKIYGVAAPEGIAPTDRAKASDGPIGQWVAIKVRSDGLLAWGAVRAARFRRLTVRGCTQHHHTNSQDAQASV